MGLETKIKYKPKIKISPKSVKEMFYDIKSSISKLDNSFENLSNKEILKIIEKGKYKIKNEQFDTIIDLSRPEVVMNIYRNDSEGGCQSCVSLGRETIDAQDATSGIYCKKSDPDYNSHAIGEPGVKYEGLSPKIRKHYNSPCKDWKPTFSPTIEKLLEIE